MSAQLAKRREKSWLLFCIILAFCNFTLMLFLSPIQRLCHIPFGHEEDFPHQEPPLGPSGKVVRSTRDTPGNSCPLKRGAERTDITLASCSADQRHGTHFMAHSRSALPRPSARVPACPRGSKRAARALPNEAPTAHRRETSPGGKSLHRHSACAKALGVSWPAPTANLAAWRRVPVPQLAVAAGEPQPTRMRSRRDKDLLKGTWGDSRFDELLSFVPLPLLHVYKSCATFALNETKKEEW